MLKVKSHHLWSTALLVLAVGFAGCSPSVETTETQGESTSDEKPTVVVSFPVLCDFTEEIARDTIELNCLFDRNQDPHTYRATPSHRQAVESAQLVLYGGYNLSPSIDGLIEAANPATPQVAVFEQAVANPIVGGHAHEHGHGHEHEHEHEEETTASGDEELAPDPHVWHDVQNAIAMVEIIRDRLAEIKPDEADFYDSNAQQLRSELEQLDAWIKQQVATIPEGQRQLITTHDSLNYYIQAYGFAESESLQGLSTEEDPTAARVKELVETIEVAKVPTIFAETTTNEKAIATVAREANVKVAQEKLIVGGLGEADSETGTYVGTIAHNTCAIVNGLGGQCTPFQ
jgi:ABC-type Zn uptake system ZnuABC Zn-binding protein ZnuA